VNDRDLEQRVVGPGFHTQVHDVVRKVPAGAVTTYGDVATLLGSPRVARHVGWALSALKDGPTDVPWHRVINARGQISHRGDIWRASEQAQRLMAEGIVFDDNGRCDLKKIRWRYDADEA
jgi:methylated-DNA-protein-cysteine methyltransferase-like protein